MKIERNPLLYKLFLQSKRRDYGSCEFLILFLMVAQSLYFILKDASSIMFGWISVSVWMI